MLGKLSIRTPNGPRVVACQSGGSIPHGLALTLVPLDDSAHAPALWSITKIDSGHRIGCGWVQLQDARHAAERLAEIVDWTHPWRLLADDADVRRKVETALAEYAEELERRDA